MTTSAWYVSLLIMHPESHGRCMQCRFPSLTSNANRILTQRWDCCISWWQNYRQMKIYYLSRWTNCWQSFLTLLFTPGWDRSDNELYLNARIATFFFAVSNGFYFTDILNDQICMADCGLNAKFVLSIALTQSFIAIIIDSIHTTFNGC